MSNHLRSDLHDENVTPIGLPIGGGQKPPRKLLAGSRQLMGALGLACLIPSPANASEPAALPTSAVAATNPLSWAAPRIEAQKKLAKDGGFQVMLLGDSITEGWETKGREAFDKEFATHFTSANFGVAGDRTENILWRLENGCLDGALDPKAIMLMVGTNNTEANTPKEIAIGIKTIVDKLTARFPKAQILLLGTFPRQDKNNAVVEKINRLLPRLDKRGNVHFMDIGANFSKDGKPDPALYSDHVHINAEGYAIWAKAVSPVLQKYIK